MEERCEKQARIENISKIKVVANIKKYKISLLYSNIRTFRFQMQEQAQTKPSFDLHLITCSLTVPFLKFLGLLSLLYVFILFSQHPLLLPPFTDYSPRYPSSLYPAIPCQYVGCVRGLPAGDPCRYVCLRKTSSC